MSSHRIHALLGFALALLLAAPAHAADPTFTGVGDLPGGATLSAVTGVSGNGLLVCGYSGAATGEMAFRWTDPALGGAGMQPLGDLPGGAISSQATGVAANGGYIVGYSVSANGNEAFRWSDPALGGGMQPLGDLAGGAFFSIGSGINADGRYVTGHSESAMSGSLGAEAFRWSATQTGAIVLPLGDLPGSNFFSVGTGISSDGTVICGYSTSAASGPASSEAARWTAATGLVGLGDLPGGGFGSNAFGISANGHTIVGLSAAATGVLAFRWTNPATGGAGMQSLGDLPGGSVYSRANAVTADGNVVVGQSIGPEGMEAFVWSAADGMRSVKTLLTDAGLDLTGWTLEVATGISADALTIVGYGTNPSGDPEGWVARFPSPIWVDVGHALAGTTGEPLFTGNGTLVPSTIAKLALSGAKPQSLTRFVMGATALNAPFHGGVLVPYPHAILLLSTNVAGNAEYSFAWQPGFPSGFTFWAQAWILDAGGPAGFAASNALMVTVP